MASAAPKKNRRGKIELITIGDEESFSQQPLKTIKKEVQEAAHPLTIAELQQQLMVEKRNNQRLIVIAGEKQARIEFLEGLVDTKPEVLQAKTTEAKELEKKVDEHENGRREDLERINEMASKLAEYNRGQHLDELQRQKVIDLTNQLKEERRRANEDRKRALGERMRDQERIESLTAKLEEFEQHFSLQQHQLIPLQQEELQPNEEVTRDAEVPVSHSTVESNDKALEVVKETTNADEPRNRVDELCPEMVEMVNRMLSKEENHPIMQIDEMVNCGFVAFLVRGLGIDDVKVQDLCAFGLAKICGTPENISKVAEAGATVLLIQLMTHSNLELARKATFAVCSIVGESAQLRDLFLRSNGVETLMILCGKLNELSTPLVRVLSWMISRLCRHSDSQAPIEVLGVLVQGLLQLLQHEDSKVRSHSCWALSHITAGTYEQRKLVLDSGVLPLVCKHLNDDDCGLAESAVKVLLKMTAGSDTMKQAVVDLDVLGALPAVVQKAKKRSVVKECCMISRNLMTGTKDHRQAVISNGLLTKIVNIMQSEDSTCHRVCSEALGHLARKGTTAQIHSLLAEKPMAALAVVLTNPDCVSNVLDVILKLLSTAGPKQLVDVKEEANESGILEHLKKLKESTNKKVQSLSCKILSKYFAENGQTGGKNEKEEKEKSTMKRKKSVTSDEAKNGGSAVANTGEKKKKANWDDIFE